MSRSASALLLALLAIGADVHAVPRAEHRPARRAQRTHSGTLRASVKKKGRTAKTAHTAGRAHIEKHAPTRRPGGAPDAHPASDAGTAPRVPRSPSDPHEQRVSALRDQLTAALHDRPLNKTRVGVEVMVAGNGEVLFAHNADQMFNPASNTKMLTTAAALTELGGDFHYRTRLYGAEPDALGVVRGDVDLRGAGDPSLTTADLAELARAVASRGVTRIEGDVVADGRFRDPSHPDRPVGEQAIILNRNSFAIVVHPGSPGQRAGVEVQPEAEYFTVRSDVKTVAGKKTRVRVDVAREEGRLVVLVKGRVNPRADAVVRKRIGDAALYAASTLRRALLDFGVEVTGTARSGGISGSAPCLAEHLSRPLSEICRVSNKDSNNFVAETIFKTVGGERYGAPGTLAKGRQAVAELMSPLGFKPDSYKILNGSGLTHENRIAPSGLARLLRHLYFDLSVAPEFLASLAVAGIDGTIRNRFRGTDAVGLVRAKTGTLSGVSALSGYVGERGDVLIFSILVEGFRHRRLAEVRHAQVRMVEAMLRYLRAERPLPSTPLPDRERPELPMDDSEDDGDAALSGGGE